MSSKRRLRRRSCEGKRSYPTDAIGVREAKRAQARLGGVTIRCYKCQFCHKWHIGRPNQRIKQAIEQKRRYS